MNTIEKTPNISIEKTPNISIEKTPNTSIEKTPTVPPYTIKHLIISGGGVYGFSFYGMLKELNLNKVWNISNIKTIHATSAGTVIATIIALNYDWETMDKYIYNKNIFEPIKINISLIMQLFQNCGIYDGKQILNEYFENLFIPKNMDVNISLKEFFEKTQIEIHYFATSVYGFKVEDISYKTHPEWTVIEAIYASCSIPFIFKPFIKNENIFIDGAFLINYPVKMCPYDENEMFGINLNLNTKNTTDIENILNMETRINDLKQSLETQTEMTLHETCDLLQNDENKLNIYKFCFIIVENIFINVTSKYICKIQNQISLTLNVFNSLNFNLIKTVSQRKELIQYGINIAKKFINK
jgi:predicted acylesterase/phospholipase RssA